MAKYTNNKAGIRDFLRNYRKRGDGGVIPTANDLVWDSNRKTWKVGDPFKQLYPGGTSVEEEGGLIATPHGSPGPTMGVPPPEQVPLPTNPNTPVTSPGEPGGGVVPPPTAPPEPGTTPGATPTDNFDDFNADVVRGVQGTYDATKSFLEESRGQAKNAAENRLRERIGGLANQQRQGITDDYVGRGLGASPVLQKNSALGGVNRNEIEAVTSGLIDLDSEYQNRYLEGLGRLNDSTANFIGLGGDRADYELGVNELREDASQFDDDLIFKREEGALDRTAQERLAKLMNSGKVPGDLMAFLQTILSQL